MKNINIQILKYGSAIICGVTGLSGVGKVKLLSLTLYTRDDN